MTTPRVLRPYQDEAVSAVLSEWGSETRRTAVVLPTGSGKSSVLAKIATESARAGLRVLMLAHRGELLDQMADTVTAVDPDMPRPGIVRSDSDEHEGQIVAGSFQTLTHATRLARVGRRQVLLCDETHHASADSYRRVIENFGPDTFFCGFTATLRRDDGKPLRDMIDSVSYEKNLRWAIENNFLVKPVGITVRIPDLDLAMVKTTAGDFAQGDLAEVMEAETPEIVKAILLHCQGRRPIIFAASVAGAHDIAALLCAQGFTAEAVTGAMSYDSRQPVYERFRSGSTQALVTVQVLTEGADFPMCDAVVIARPTQSQNLYSQMCGRSLRLYEGKQDALILDLVGVSRVLKLVTLSSLDTGVVSKNVDTDGEELPPEDDDEIPDALDGLQQNRRIGPIDTIGIDLLGPYSTGINWLGTRKGTPFVTPIDSGYAWFLWETEHHAHHGPMYKVGYMSVKGDKRGEWLEHGKALPLLIAVGIAEDDIINKGFGFPLRKASWRRNASPSPAQLNFAQSLGIEESASMSRARLSDEITITLVSRRLDGAR